MYWSIETSNFRDVHNNLEYIPKTALLTCFAKNFCGRKMTKIEDGVNKTTRPYLKNHGC